MSGISNTFLTDLARFKTFSVARASSWDRTGGNHDALPIEPHATAVLADLEGPGIISHVWFTIGCKDRLYLRKLLLRVYWDGEPHPSIETPVGDFFGVGHARTASYQCLAFNMSTHNEGSIGGGAAMNCWLPMPFRKRARFEIVNDCDVPVSSFYYYIDWQKNDRLDDDLAYLHAQWRRENPCEAVDLKGVNLTGADNYVILEATGRGHYIGCNFSIDNLSGDWWGEGDDMIFVDGATWPPTLHGTGSEDYLAQAWGMQRNAFLFNGMNLWTDPAFNERGKVTVYRHHILDPIPFERSIRVTIEHGHANDRGDDWSSVAYWYQSEPHQVWSPVPPVEQRLPRL
jgi:hypothetical protein